MTAEVKTRTVSVPSPLLRVRVSTGEFFHDTVRQLSIRFALYVGYAESVAAEIGRAVNRAVDALADVSGADDLSAIEIDYGTPHDVLEITVRCTLETAGDHAGVPPGSDAASRIDAAMDRVEFTREGMSHVCRLSRQLPPDSN